MESALYSSVEAEGLEGEADTSTVAVEAVSGSLAFTRYDSNLEVPKSTCAAAESSSTGKLSKLSRFFQVPPMEPIEEPGEPGPALETTVLGVVSVKQ